MCSNVTAAAGDQHAPFEIYVMRKRGKSELMEKHSKGTRMCHPMLREHLTFGVLAWSILNWQWSISAATWRLPFASSVIQNGTPTCVLVCACQLNSPVVSHAAGRIDENTVQVRICSHHRAFCACGNGNDWAHLITAVWRIPTIHMCEDGRSNSAFEWNTRNLLLMTYDFRRKTIWRSFKPLGFWVLQSQRQDKLYSPGMRRRRRSDQYLVNIL